MRYLTNKDGDEVVRGLVELGWTVERARDHLIVRNPADRNDRLTLSTGRHLDPEHLKKIRSKLRRARKALYSGPDLGDVQPGDRP